MANSGNFNTNKYSTQYNGTIGLNLSWSITSQSTADNTSTIHWVLKSNGSMSSGYYVKGGPITVTIGGVTVLNITSRINVNGSGGFTRNGNITITHDENGDKSVSMSVRAALYSSSVNCTGSKTYALDHIDRYAIIDSATDTNSDDYETTITYSNPAGSDLTTGLYVRCKWMNGSTEETTSWSPQLSDDGGVYYFSLANYRNALFAACANSNTLPITVDLKSTMNGVEYHDTKVITMTMVNVNPDAGSVLYWDTNTTVAGITGDDEIIVQSQSTLKITTTGEAAKKGASITSIIVNFNGADYDITSTGEVDIVKPTYSGTFTATATVTDSRGNKSTATRSITIIPWSTPTAQCTLARVNGFETNTVLTVNATYSAIGTNAVTIMVYYRIIGAPSWSGPFYITNNTPVTYGFDNTKEWEVEVTVLDSFPFDNYTSYYLTVGKGIPIAFIDTDMGSVGIHGFPDADNQLYVGGDVKVTGEIEVGDAASTRTNLGLGCTSLLSSPLTSGSTTVNASGYNTLLLIGKGGQATPSQTILVPVSYLSASEVSFSFTHGYESQYTYIYLSISNSVVTIRFGGTDNNGSLQAVYGVN